MTLAVRLFPKDDRLKGLSIRPTDRRSDCWFDDGIKLCDLGVARSDIDWFMPFSTSKEDKGNAINAVIAFDEFMMQIENSGINITMQFENRYIFSDWIIVTLVKSNRTPKSIMVRDAFNNYMARTRK